VKIKLDENLPERLVPELAKLGHDADTVRAEYLTGRPDNEIWQAAQSMDRFLITPRSGLLRRSPIRAWDTRRIATGASRAAWPGCPGCPGGFAVCDGACRSVEGMLGRSD